MNTDSEVGHEVEYEPIRDSMKVKAVYDDDLAAYLTSLGLDPNGILGRCKFCHDDVTMANLAALFPESGALKVICDKRECLVAVQGLIRDGVVKL